MNSLPVQNPSTIIETMHYGGQVYNFHFLNPGFYTVRLSDNGFTSTLSVTASSQRQLLNGHHVSVSTQTASPISTMRSGTVTGSASALQNPGSENRELANVGIRHAPELRGPPQLAASHDISQFPPQQPTSSHSSRQQSV